ncbi:MAG TPA: response regulator transcription factor, partial [Candidatus Omnitrophota bacterium]|nr:response regulator transcription factor [Candidatus Omnitrophota bacterium]
MKKKKVLIVDDEKNVAKTLVLLLETRGYAIDVAETGQQALQKATQKPDIILLDLVLPDISGFEICRKLREQKDTKQIPIIILSVRYLYEDKIEGLYLGADDYITKPFEYEELFARMEAVMRRREA